MARFGVRLDPVPQFSAQDSVDLALVAESRGYEVVWAPEGGGRDALTQLSAFALSTSRIKLGTGILPVFSRTPTLTAMSAVGMDMISGHRFILGLGVGHQDSVEGSHGVPFHRPVARIRETVDIVRRLMRGEKISHEGRVFNVKSANLGFSQEFQVPIYIAALGPKMIELAGEVADGVLLNWATPAYMEEAMEHLEIGARRAGRSVEDVDVACYIRVAITPDEESVRAPLRRQILRYSRMDYYRNFFNRTGFGEETEAISRYLAEGDQAKAASAVSDEMQRQLAVFGSVEYCRQEVERRRSLGIKMPVVAPFAVGGAFSSYRAAIEAFSS